MKKNFHFLNFQYHRQSIDSTGDSIPKQIKKLVERIKLQAENLNISLNYKINTFKHQYSNTECGMYVLVIIILLLKNKIKLNYLNKRITDKEMMKIRKIIFN